MTITESIRDWIRSYPLIDNNLRVNIDWLPEDSTEYTIDSVPGDAVVQRYIDGSAKKQALFVFGSREPYGSDVLQNIDNSGFYEEFSKWVEEQNDAGNLPVLETGKTPIKVDVLSTAYVFQSDAETARYQIQCRLLYMEVK